MAQDQQTDPNALAQDKDFAAAPPEEQAKYLSAQDPDFAKASKEDQVGYLQHLTGNPASVQAGLAPAAGAPPSPDAAAKTMQTGRTPFLTSFGAQAAKSPGAMYSGMKSTFFPSKEEYAAQQQHEEEERQKPAWDQVKDMGST